MTPAEIGALLGPKGPLADLPDYEHRPAQVALAEFVAEALGNGERVQVEAGTGLGKSLAYLLPMLLRAREMKRPAVVSTATLTLQEQITRHDASLLRTIVPDLRLVVLKGRAHYPCPRACELLAPGPLREQALEALRGGATEREAFPREVQSLWGQLSAANCEGDCAGCPLKSAREAARHADLIVVNHALLLADEDGTVLPEFGSLVIDEAHRLIDVATEARSLCGTTVDLDALLEIGVPGSLRHAAHELHGLLTELILQTAKALAPRLSGHDLRVSVRSDDPDLAGALATHRRVAPRLSLWLGAVAELPLFGPARLYFNAILNRIVDFALALDAFFAPPAGVELVRWFDFGDGSLHVAPLEVGPALEATLWRRCQGALLISATLAGPRGDFDFASFGLVSGRTLRLDSTFDYSNQCLLAVPGDLSPVSDEAHAREVAAAILGLAFARNGRTLALFTSHAELQRVDELLQPLLEPRGIRVLAQGRSGERGALLGAFREGGAVLLGTSTFWEGIDLIGQVLEVLVISRLPFDVPTDPLHSARARQKRDPFRDYTLPRTAVRLRQGFGRLIRSERDRGVVVILDPRLREKAYGAELAASLPECTLFRGARAELPELVRNFLGDSSESSESSERRLLAVG